MVFDESNPWLANVLLRFQVVRWNPQAFAGIVSCTARITVENRISASSTGRGARFGRFYPYNSRFGQTGHAPTVQLAKSANRTRCQPCDSRSFYNPTSNRAPRNTPTAIQLSGWEGCVEGVATLWRTTRGLPLGECVARRVPQECYPFDTTLSEWCWDTPSALPRKNSRMLQVRMGDTPLFSLSAPVPPS